eukprot:COSAG05_NODE_1572_length_4520_cov_2.148157_2_plen_232_part_00
MRICPPLQQVAAVPNDTAPASSSSPNSYMPTVVSSSADLGRAWTATEWAKAAGRILFGASGWSRGPALRIKVDEAFSGAQQGIIQSIELWAGIHVFLVTQDELGRRMQHHFFDLGFEGTAGHVAENRRLILLKRQTVTNGVSSEQIKDAMVAAGPYRLLSNNCLHSAKRGLDAAQASAGLPNMMVMQAVIFSMAFLLGGGGAILVCAAVHHKSSADKVDEEASFRLAEQAI